MTVTEDDLERAAEKGAEKALAKVGLADEYAGEDIRHLRNLLKAWRSTKSTIWQTIIRYLTMFVLGAISIGVWLKVK